MSVDLLSDVLLWSAVINYGVLVVWFAMFTLGHDWMRRLHGRWFRLLPEQFDAIHYALMGFYKICIIVFNLVPYIALRIAA
jgi:hypothetical protein